jgi:hypothetical protein
LTGGVLLEEPTLGGGMLLLVRLPAVLRTVDGFPASFAGDEQIIAELEKME